MENKILMNDSLLWKSLPLSEQPPRNHATNVNNIILLNKIYLMCFNVWFSLWFMLLVVRCVAQLEINVWHCSLFYNTHKSPVLLFQKLIRSADFLLYPSSETWQVTMSQVVQKTLNKLPESRTMVALDKGESYCSIVDSNDMSINWI